MEIIANKRIIIGHQLLVEEDSMPNILKRAIVLAIVIVFLWGIFTTFYTTPSYVTALLLIILGVTLAVVDIVSKTTRHSAIKIGAISRGEFYGIITVMVGCLFYLNVRIDSLFQLLIALK